jgi:DnaJ family protein C protein 28
MMDRKVHGIDEIIQQAMRDGAFDNLPGKGKPLELVENPYLDREWQLAYHLLKENGFAPEFVEKRQVIEMGLAAARQDLALTWAWRSRALAEGKPANWIEAEWGRAKTKFEELTAKLNKDIKTYNLGIPTPSLYRKLVDVNIEIGSIERQ